jgi:excisionase family DNA binding protein
MYWKPRATLTQADKGRKQMSCKKELAVATRALQDTPIRGKTAPDEELLRMRDVAAILRCSVAQTYRLANAGDIPTFRCRGMVRVPRAPLMAWIAGKSTSGSAS